MYAQKVGQTIFDLTPSREQMASTLSAMIIHLTKFPHLSLNVLACFLDNSLSRLYMMERDLMSLQSVMKLEMGTDQTIRCRFVSKWFKIDSYVYTKEGLFSEIEKNKPDVVLMDLDLYEKMDGIETSQKIRNRFDVPVVHV